MTTNAMADQVNHAYQERLGGQAEVYTGSIRGSFGERQLPTHDKLRLRVGARVMLLSNDEDGRWINGDLGKIVALAKASQADGALTVELDGGTRVRVARYTWEVIRFVYNRERGRIESEVIGSFTQYPLRLAWAVTIHKAQGKTFDQVVVDFGRGDLCTGSGVCGLEPVYDDGGLVFTAPAALAACVVRRADQRLFARRASRGADRNQSGRPREKACKPINTGLAGMASR